MTTSPFELALGLLVHVILGVLLLGFVARSLRRGYAVGFWWDFQRQAEPVRFWCWIVFVTFAGLSAFWLAVQEVLKLRGFV
jgi:hypothetical protein